MGFRVRAYGTLRNFVPAMPFNPSAPSEIEQSHEPMMSRTVRALIIRIGLGVPHHKYSILGPKTLF